MLDLAIRNGLVIDGTGAAGRRVGVGVAGDRIVEIGTVGPAREEFDATGLVVSPGFIDPHSHSDWTLHVNREAHSTIRQGVTTEVVGNCGITNAPVTAASAEFVAGRMRLFGYDQPITWGTFGDYLSDVEAGGITQNLAFFVGHSTIRAAAGVSGGWVDDDASRIMADLTREAMEAGALGLSSGLEYSLGAFAGTDELRALTAVVGEFDGMYASHVRNRDVGIVESVEEFLAIARAGNLAGQISHLNVRHDTNAPPHGWERAVELMMAARESGMDIQADATPFRHGLGMMTGILPTWLIDHGYEAVAEALAEPSLRNRLRTECDRYWRFIHKGQWERVRLQNSPQFPELAGKTFPEIAAMRRQDVWDSYLDILQAAGPQMGDLLLVGELFTEEHLAQTITHPLFALGVDAYTSVDHGPLSEATVSPLPYRGHIEYLAHHVRERGILPLEEAIRKMSGMPAERFGLKQRGRIEPGYFADLVVFDFPNLASDSTFERPAVYPRGIRLVTVNGVVVVTEGAHTGDRAGRVLRRVGAAT